MNIARSLIRLADCRALVASIVVALAPSSGLAHETGSNHVHFQKPAAAAKGSAGASTLKFRSASGRSGEAATAPATAEQPAPQATDVAAAPTPQPTLQQVAKPLAAAKPQAQRAVVQQPAFDAAKRPAFTRPGGGTGGQLADYRPGAGAANRVVTLDGSQPTGRPTTGAARLNPSAQLQQASFFEGVLGGQLPSCGYAEPLCGCGEPSCGICEPACGLAEPVCGMEPACGILEPGCGVTEPACGVMDPGCGLVEPACGCGEAMCDGVDCGSCVGNPGPDYWCFPVCLPRLKDFSVWAGVHGFKGPRDSALLGGPRDGNFGFQEGLNLGGRAPLVGLVFPQISYQLGYQAVQSQLSGNSAGSTEDRSQNFVTAGLFRRVPAGLQFGAVWDYQDDDFIADSDFQQIRYEVSVKSQRGREIGFWGATHTNTELIGATEFQAVDQFNVFLRFHFRQSGELRFWGGATNDGEGTFGADAFVPFSNRWSLQTGFNYLIPDEDAGVIAAREESWNIFTNLVWHFGNTGRATRTNPHRPLFPMADNGYMFVDQRP